jgi:hypothetical protein
MHRIPFSVEQARKVVATVPPRSFYYQEAVRCLRDQGLEPTPPQPPSLGIDQGGLGYRSLNDDDGDGL